MPYKKQKAISSNKKHNKYGLMTDLGLLVLTHLSQLQERRQHSVLKCEARPPSDVSL